MKAVLLILAAILGGLALLWHISQLPEWRSTGDGREVWCIHDGYGISCDWARARQLPRMQINR